MRRVGVTDGFATRKDITYDVCCKAVQELVEEGYMVSANNGEYVRTINKTEQRKKKKYVEDVA